ncbi:hypothetical protein NA56DRAFT_258582 [Hyaloscypha hepaticicola]|uniref:BTB domain-containing protein n=1 Tax=Hyaloscypha hepaticicola TaxID=2082293 RepID=A0A2J6PVQ4_9HELO|nr:hypothetical protein NA56DRAFT_258582 [Hyaloscypha hepaticicola]
MNVSGSKPARDYCQDLGTEIVQLVVGSDRKIFSVHKKLLCSVSEFFDKALTGRFAEASSNQMDLPEDHPAIVSMFISWLYTEDLKFDMYECDENSGVTTLIDLYVFADAKRCNALKNAAMDTLQDGLYRSHLFLCLSHVELVFEKTCTNEEAPIRCFFVEALAQGVREKFWEVEDLSNLFRSHPEVLSDYLRLQMCSSVPELYGAVDLYRRGGSEKYGICAFHVHAEGETCTSEEGQRWTAGA